ncbi:MAG TPA: metallopeptidase family protein [Candidatus Saccharimonadales bacterium]|nr:metallopeptidase family protein [Candidatus Saccharimonadales bacterium]
MVRVSEERFRKMVTEAVDSLPERFGEHIQNVIFVVEREPSDVQREKLRLRGDSLLFGLYEGVPLTRRGSGQTFLLPDKITIFMDALLFVSATVADLQDKIKHTVWHEVAHYFGLSHAQIDALDRRRKENSAS